MSRIEQIRDNAIRLIAQHGFGTMSLRQLAKSCGLQAGSLYAYYQSKDDLLLDLIVNYLEDLQESWQKEDPASDSVHRLEAFIAHHLLFQSARKAESLIVSLDLRSLPDDSRQQIVDMKTHYEQELQDILEQGRRQGLFNLDDATSTVILSMLTGLGMRESGPEDHMQQFIQPCQKIALQIAGAGHLPTPRHPPAKRPQQGWSGE